MNRIKISPLASTSTRKSGKQQASRKIPRSKILASVFAADQEAKTSSEIAVFAPLNYEPNYAYPLIVWLHSDGQSAEQLESLMTSLSVQNYVGVSPQGPMGNFQCGYFWEQDFDSINAARESVTESIDRAVAQFNINPKRIFLAGAEGGGTMALRLALEEPDRFAGVMSLNGPLPTGHSPFAQWSRCRNMPVFWSHFRDQDEGQPDMCNQFRFLFSAGFLNVTAREYPTVQHMEKMAPAAINRWIMEQIESAIL